MGSSGPPQGHASSHRAEVAMVCCQATLGPGHPHHVEMATVMDVSCQATLGLCHPLLAGDGHSDKEEIAQEGPHRKPPVERDPASGSCRAMLEQSCLCPVIPLSP